MTCVQSHEMMFPLRGKSETHMHAGNASFITIVSDAGHDIKMAYI